MCLVSLELILEKGTVYDIDFFLIWYEVVLSPFIKKSVLFSFIFHDTSHMSSVPSSMNLLDTLVVQLVE